MEPAGEASSVIFYVDGLQVCALSKPPFECDWDAGVEVVEHQIRAVATLTGARHLVSNVRTKGFDYTESVDVRSVQLTATVSDNRGHFVKGLPKSSFRVFEDDRLQTISHFEAENVALDLIVALDISASMGPSMPALKQAAKEFLTAIPTTNRVTLLAFNDTSFTLARGATNPADRIRAVDRLVPGVAQRCTTCSYAASTCSAPVPDGRRSSSSLTARITEAAHPSKTPKPVFRRAM